VLRVTIAGVARHRLKAIEEVKKSQKENKKGKQRKKERKKERRKEGKRKKEESRL
jgi:hypothetical protein